MLWDAILCLYESREMAVLDRILDEAAAAVVGVVEEAEEVVVEVRISRE